MSAQAAGNQAEPATGENPSQVGQSEKQSHDPKKNRGDHIQTQQKLRSHDSETLVNFSPAGTIRYLEVPKCVRGI